MKAFRWLLIASGFAWITYVSKVNEIVPRVGWLDKMAEEYPAEKTYRCGDVIEAMRRNSLHIQDHQTSPMWGALAMLVGAFFLTIRRSEGPP
jgi:hypothetical protein